MILGFKGFKPGLVATLGNGKFQYVPNELNETKKAMCASTGFHYCLDPWDCLNWYTWNGKNEFWAVAAGGDVDEDGYGSRSSCTKLVPLRKLTAEEFLLIFFMRRKADPNTPWYTLEVEPGGTVRQKRSYNNDQYADLEDAKPFIAEWQQVVQGRMTAAEIDFARQSKEIRAQEFAELKENGNIIRTGANAGKLLVDELMHDLMEVEKRVG